MHHDETETVTEETNEPLSGPLAAFKRDMEDSFSKLGSAALYLQAVTATIESAGQRVDSSLEAHKGLTDQSTIAVEAARNLLLEMRQVRDEVNAARQETAELRDNVSRMAGDLSALTEDLRARIAALAVLGQPLRIVPEPEDDHGVSPVFAESF